ncbi:MAG: serpin family protein [Bacillota bacterium]|nr:serpin family protein [Bacillota bacterium]
MKKLEDFKKLALIGIPAAAAVIAFVMLFTLIFSQNASMKVQADDLMKGITPQKVEHVELSEQFLQSTANFSVDLFKKSYTKGKNSLVSPTSVYMALGMTANGADGSTLKEFEALLGKQAININELNSYYNTIADKLTTVQGDKVNIANSIWYKNDSSLNVKKDFLQTNADYYNAAAYKADFNSEQTVQDINNWVKANTGKQIDKIVDKIDANTVMYLVNTVYFDAQWEVPYNGESVHRDNFSLADGSKKSVDFMNSIENQYIKDTNAEGFIKPYKDKGYSFVALLPDYGVNIDGYISSLSGSKFINLIKNRTGAAVVVALPKFKSDYSIQLEEPLKQMGLKDCFDEDKADFSKMVSSSKGNIYISDVLHKTFISVDTKGTKASAATKVEFKLGGGIDISKSVILNRPFVYAIIDNETKLPLFIGTMMNPQT